MPSRRTHFFSLLLLAVGIVACDDSRNVVAPSDPTSPAVVRVIPARVSYRPGQRIDLSVRIENGTNVGSVSFHLRYDPRRVEFLPPATEGPFLGSDGAGTIFLANDSVAGDEVVVGHARAGAPSGVTGAGVLATFGFRVLSPAESHASFVFTEASIKDPLAQNLPASFVGASVALHP